jgi:hypothetical protein
MIPTFRRAYNASFTLEKYRAYQERLERRAGGPIPFRLAETPVFLSPDLLDDMVRGSLDIFEQLSKPAALERSKSAVPPEWDVPGCPELPTFAVTDFAITRDRAGRLAPRLIELQAFPTLYAFQIAQCEELAAMTPGGEALEWYLSGLDSDGYTREVGDAILDGHSSENVVLLDLDPPRQKTAVDFVFTQKLWGVRAIDPSEVDKRGRELYYAREGKPTRIHRIYNRLIFDELAASGRQLPFDFREPLDLSWAGHPNWYFRWSKHALPALRHPLVPAARLLSDFDRWPEDLAGWVYKPLFSFAGSGVKVDVTREDLEAVPLERRDKAILMRKVDYAPVIETADGGTSKVEIRIMFVWKDGRPLPVTTLARLSQGKMMGVAFNKDRTWVGSSGCLWPRGAAPELSS